MLFLLQVYCGGINECAFYNWLFILTLTRRPILIHLLYQTKWMTPGDAIINGDLDIKRQRTEEHCPLDSDTAGFLYSANLIFRPETTDCCENTQLVILLCGKVVFVRKL